MQNVGPLNGANLLQDYQASAPARVSLVPGVIGSSSLAVTTNSVAAGEAFVLAERTNGEKVLVHFRSTEAVAVDTSGTTKVFVKIDQAKIDDGSTNSVDGTGIASIQTAASYPASNFIPLASVTSGSITDERTEVKYYGKDFEGLVGFDKGADIASASTVDLGAATGNIVHVTGTTGITSFGSSAQPGTFVTVVFDGALTLTHNATSLILPSGTNITTASGDSAAFVCESSGNWRCVSYVKANGTAIIATTDINGLTEDATPDTDADFIIEYDASAGANKKVLPSRYRASDAQALAGTDTKLWITSKQAKDNYWTVIFASDNILANSSATVNDNSWNYVKKKEISIGKAGTYRTYFGLYRNGGTSQTVYGRIYKNGVALWTERSTSGTTEVFFSEDFAFVAGDLVQLYLKGVAATASSASNTLQIRASAFPSIPSVTL